MLQLVFSAPRLTYRCPFGPGWGLFPKYVYSIRDLGSEVNRKVTKKESFFMLILVDKLDRSCYNML